MAGKVYVAEYSAPRHRLLQQAHEPPFTYQAPITAGNSSQSFSPFGASTEFIRIAVDTGGAVCIAWNIPATINHEYVPSPYVEWRVVNPGDYLSVIASNATAGSDALLLTDGSSMLLLTDGVSDLLLTSV